MKKIYFLAVALTFGLTANAQLTDGFEDYPIGPYYGGHWSNWSNNPSTTDEHIIVSDGNASQGTKSGYIGGGGIQDAILDVGMKNGGIWSMSMDLYIDFFASGYFNAQGDLSALGATGNWLCQAYIGLDPTQEGTPQDPGTFYMATRGVAYSFPYPEEQWFNMGVEYNLDNQTMRMFVDGTEMQWVDADGNLIEIPLGDEGSPFLGMLNGFDFFSADVSTSMYIDEINFYGGPFMGLNDIEVSEISVYPTVSSNVINVSSKSAINSLSVYNLNGQEVMKLRPNSSSTQINISSLNAGVYILKIQSGNQTTTKKVVVK